MGSIGVAPRSSTPSRITTMVTTTTMTTMTTTTITMTMTIGA